MSPTAVCVPTARTVPRRRVDERAGTLAVALNCVAPSGVPCVMAAGVAQEMYGVIFVAAFTTRVRLAVAVVYRVGVGRP